MDSFNIGISGLNAAQRGLDIVGNNIANAATPGYHRQRANFDPSRMVEMGEVLVGGGVDFSGTTRIVNSFLEAEITKQFSSQGQIDQQLQTLRTLETAFGELAAGDGLAGAIDEFYQAMEELSRYPDDSIWQNNALSSAKVLTGKFRSMAHSIEQLRTQAVLEAETAVDQVNLLASQIAELNQDIQVANAKGHNLHNTKDQRDQLIKELAQMIGVETVQRPFGVIDVAVSGIPLVTGNTTTKLSTGLNSDGKLGLAVAGEADFRRLVSGGKIGGLLRLHNEHLAQAKSDLDHLANAISGDINKMHVMGVGSAGSFTELTGSTMRDQQLDRIQPPVSAGSIHFRVTDTATGEVSRHQVQIDPAQDTLADVAARITAQVPGINADIISSQLNIKAQSGFEFDFLPGVLSEPTATAITADPPPEISISGIYDNMADQAYTFEVTQADGSIGNGTVSLTVTNSQGQLVREIELGAGYVAGSTVNIADGVKVSFGPGQLNVGDTFQAQAIGNTDTSGLLNAAGINTFFTGHDAATMNVHGDIAGNPERIATSISPTMTDNHNALRMAQAKDKEFVELGNLSPREFYRRMVVQVGQEIHTLTMQRDNTEAVINNLDNQIQGISGVNINDEAAKMLLYQQMFQGMSRYLTTLQSSLKTLMDSI